LQSGIFDDDESGGRGAAVAFLRIEGLGMIDTTVAPGWMQVALLWLLYLAVHYLCWVRFPPRERQEARQWTDETPWER
jgi:hypothetical protein